MRISQEKYTKEAHPIYQQAPKIQLPVQERAPGQQQEGRPQGAGGGMRRRRRRGGGYRDRWEQRTHQPQQNQEVKPLGQTSPEAAQEQKEETVYQG